MPDRDTISWRLSGEDDKKDEDGGGFDALMSQLGVRRMDERAPAKPAGPSATDRAAHQREAARQAMQPPPRSAKPPDRPPAPPGRVGVQTTVTVTAPSARPAAPPAAPGAATAAAGAVAPVPAPEDGQKQDLLKQLAATRADAAAEREARQRLQARLQALEEERDRAVGQSESLHAALENTQLDLRRLQRRLQGEQPSPPRLAEILEQRGVKGPDEAGFLMRVLIETRQIDGLIARLQAEDPEMLLEWLEDRLALLCAEHLPLAPVGRGALTVPPARCELCGGADVQRVIRHFLDACLINGITRVTIVGGGPKQHRLLRQLVQHRSLRLQLVPGLLGGASRRGSDQARLEGVLRVEVAESDAVVLWCLPDGDELRARFAGGGRAQVLAVAQPSLARCLAEIAERLQG